MQIEDSRGSHSYHIPRPIALFYSDDYIYFLYIGGPYLLATLTSPASDNASKILLSHAQALPAYEK